MTNNQLKKARQEFLDEMVSFYSADPVGRRAVEGTSCCYKTKDGRKCSIGRYIPDDKYDPSFEGKNILCLCKDGKLDILPNHIQELGGMFLRDVQHLHDENYYWNTVSLTELGISRKIYIENKYINSLPDDDNEVQGN